MSESLRDHARAIVESEELEVKLGAPEGPLDDSNPGEPLRIEGPGRPANLRIVASPGARVPAIGAMADVEQRLRIVHSFANHELQATELFAWALLAFPEAPAAFRRGLLAVLRDEQRHTRMYCARLEAMGASFGDFPVSGYFWSKIPDITSPLRFACAMGLTFENANLDHTLDYAQAARDAGDEELAAVIDRVHADEITHVRFGWTWLERRTEADSTPWDTYRANVTWPLRPELARGEPFREEPRRRAGMRDDFIERLGTHNEQPRPGRARGAS